MESTRIRVTFEDRHILKKAQRRDGLNRSWIQLYPSHETISDLISHIFHKFKLNHSCPFGIILTMDGFVLPPFESVAILKDKDEIGVKRKGKLLSEITQGDVGENLIDEHKIIQKQPSLTNIPLLANEEFKNESGRSQSEAGEQEEDEEKGNHSENDLYEEISPASKNISKKRKASKKLGSSKKKKKTRIVDFQVSEDDFQVDQKQRNGFHYGESSGTKKEESEVKKKKHKKASAIVSLESNDDTSQPLPSPQSQRSSPIQEDDVERNGPAQAPDGTEKRPSRSARRKKARKHWLKEIVKAEKEHLVPSDNTSSEVGTCNVQLEKVQSPKLDANNHSVIQQRQIEICDVDTEIAPVIEEVPVVIRPGHIRFEPLEEDSDGDAIRKRHNPAEVVQWKGITNKKKGQNWGRENSTSWRDESQHSKQERTEKMETEEVKPPNDPIDFDKLAPLSRLPRGGDLIAYRLVELSSTWTPELTSYRIGKTSWYDSVSNNILLTPLLEYPVVVEKLDEENTFAQPPDNSFYNEDGSLEVEFSSLIDVRMIKESDSDPAKVSSSSMETANGDGTHASTPLAENQENAWDEINATLNAKKAELMRENGWLKENSSWSCRVMRRSAMGPTMAMLRANNEI